MTPYVETVLSSLGDLLTVQAELPVLTSTSDGMPLPAASLFDNQLYLFETVGMLISFDHLEPSKQTEYLKMALQPLVDGIQNTMAQGYNGEDELYMIQLHHYIVAIGSVAKGKALEGTVLENGTLISRFFCWWVGFPTLPKGATCDQSWAAVFVGATEIILNVLRTYNQVQLIRDSARFSFSRFITCLGSEILPYLPNLINELLTDCQITELVDFLPFVGMVAHKYRVTHV